MAAAGMAAGQPYRELSVSTPHKMPQSTGAAVYCYIHFCRIIGQDGQRVRPGRVWHNVHGALAGGAGEIHRSSAAADASECRLLGLLCWADTYVSTHIV